MDIYLSLEVQRAILRKARKHNRKKINRNDYQVSSGSGHNDGGNDKAERKTTILSLSLICKSVLYLN